MKKYFSFLLFLLASTCAFSQENDSAWFVNNYTKLEKYIPMRDGVKLFTSIYIPKNKDSRHPFLMTRTPYSCAPYGAGNYTPIWNSYRIRYAKENFIFVTQDVRGRYMSEGVFTDVRPFNKNKKGKQFDEASDTYDTIDWLLKNINNNNGKVGINGISYPGFYATQAALCNHPALVAVSPQAPVTDWFMGDDFHHKGAFFVMDCFSFYPGFGTPHPNPSTTYNHGFSFTTDDNYQAYLQTGALKNFSKFMGDSIAFWKEIFQHPNYDDWWQERNARRGLYQVKPAMLWVGGLFDAEDCYGAWNSYKATEQQSPQTNSKIVMGPWYHGQWARDRDGNFMGHIRFGSNTSRFFQDSLEIPFFIHYLLGKGDAALSEATVFFTGENQWKKLASWPPANEHEEALYLRSAGKLSFDRKGGERTPFDEYTSDPAHPVPYTEKVHSKRTREYMDDDQRFASRRPDVLSYQTPVLDKPLTLAGPVIADLMVVLTTTDADFIVKVIDVFPDDFQYTDVVKGDDLNYPMGGYQMLVRAEIMRGKFRNSFENPEPFTPGTITEVRWDLPDVAHTFLPGHRIMIQVQSSWFPLADRNPQQFMDIYNADDSDFHKANIRIYHDGIHNSKIMLPVVNSL